MFVFTATVDHAVAETTSGAILAVADINLIVGSHTL